MGLGKGLLATGLVIAGVGLMGRLEPARAIGLCDCCAAQLNESCSAACSGENKTPGQCAAVVDYSGRGTTGDGKNRLNGISLKDLSLGSPSPAQLENFRRFLERNRRRAIADYNRAASRLKRGRMTQAEFDKAAALYREAMVNYYHGMDAYLHKIGRKSD